VLKGDQVPVRCHNKAGLTTFPRSSRSVRCGEPHPADLFEDDREVIRTVG
jgi:hypothetical protein